jgi:hypothetical protein
MNEDKQGRPFVGAAAVPGKLLGAAGSPASRSISATSQVPAAREPGSAPERIDACAEYLDLRSTWWTPLVIVTWAVLDVEVVPQRRFAHSRERKEVDDASSCRCTPGGRPPPGQSSPGTARRLRATPAILERARARRLAAETEQQVPGRQQSTEQPASGPSCGTLRPRPSRPRRHSRSTNGARASLPSTKTRCRNARHRKNQAPTGGSTNTDSTPEQDDPDPAGKQNKSDSSNRTQ